MKECSICGQPGNRKVKFYDGLLHTLCNDCLAAIGERLMYQKNKGFLGRLFG